MSTSSASVDGWHLVDGHDDSDNDAFDDDIDRDDAHSDVASESDDEIDVELSLASSAASMPAAAAVSSSSSSSTSSSSLSSSTLALPVSTSSVTTTTSTSSSLKRLYNVRKNKLLGSLYNTYSTYVTGSLSTLHPLEPVWLLGRVFASASSALSSTAEPGSSTSPAEQSFMVHDDAVVTATTTAAGGAAGSASSLPPHLREFLEHFRSLLFCSYRKNFPPIVGTHFSTDAGWGCMLRTGQMMLARTILVLLYGADWRLSDVDVSSPYSPYRRVVRWFTDEPNDAPFSIHQLLAVQRSARAHAGVEQMKLSAGSWFTPTEVSCILRDVVALHQAEVEGLFVHVARDGELNRRTLLATADLAVWRPALVLIPVRLGVESLHESYLAPLRKLFQMPQSLGVFGGRPRQSFYFVGIQGDDVLYLDPHLVQNYQAPNVKFDDSTNHLSVPQRMKLCDVDPSMTIGLLLRSRADFDMLMMQLDAFVKAGVHVVSVVDRDDEALAASAPLSRTTSLQRRAVSMAAGEVVRTRAAGGNSRKSSDPVVLTVVETTPGKDVEAPPAVRPPSPSAAAATASSSPFDIAESRFCDNEDAVRALDASGALIQWLVKKKWTIVQHLPAVGKPYVADDSSDSGGLLARWRTPAAGAVRRDESGGHVELRVDSSESTKNVATAFVLAHAQGVHVHFRPQLEVMFERDDFDAHRWRISVRHYAHLKPGTASAVTLLTAGLSLVVAAGSLTKYARDAPLLVDEVWQVLGVDKDPISGTPPSISSSTSTAVSEPPLEEGWL
jgi:cysteine protease ATG4